MKNKLLYLLTIIITLFTFNINVNAAQELTCVYEKKSNGKIVLVQDKSGKLTIYHNDNDVDFNASGWKIMNYKLLFRDYSRGQSNSDVVETSLTKIENCSEYSFVTESGNEKQIIFSNEKNLAGRPLTRAKLETSYKTVKLPLILNSTKEGFTSNISCNTLKITDNLKIEELSNDIYTMSCVYAMDLNAKANVLGGDNTIQTMAYQGCHVIQIDIKNTNEMFVRQSYPFNNINYPILMSLENNLTSQNIKDNNNGWCPQNIYVNRETIAGVVNSSSLTSVIGLSKNDEYDEYPLVKGTGFNLITGDKYVEKENVGEPIDILDCNSLFVGENGENLKEILKFAVNLVKIFIPVLLIGLGIMDFAKAIFSGSEDTMKKTQAKFIKRVILAVCIFLIPTIVTFILEIFNLVWDKNISTDFCGILR